MVRGVPLIIGAVVVAAVALMALGTAVFSSSKARSQSYDSIVTPLVGLTNSAQVAKDAPGTILYVSCVNPNSSAVFLQVFNSAGVVVVGTTFAAFYKQIPPNSASGMLAPLSTGGYYASAGIQAAVTTTATGGSAPTTGVPCDIAHR